MNILELKSKIISKLKEQIPSERLLQYMNDGHLKFIEDSNYQLSLTNIDGTRVEKFWTNQDLDEAIYNFDKINNVIKNLLATSVYKQDFKRDEIKKLSSGVQENKGVLSTKEDLVFEILKNPRAGRTIHQKDYIAEIKHQDHVKFSHDDNFYQKISLGSFATIKDAKNYLNTNLLAEDKDLVEKVNSLSKTISINGDNEAIEAILKDNVKHLITETIIRTSNGGTKLENIDNFDFVTLGYTGFRIGVNHDRSHSCLNTIDKNLDDILPKEIAEDISNIVESEKSSLEEKNNSDFAKIHPFNKLESIKILWSETGDKYDNKFFNSLEDLQKALRSYYFTKTSNNSNPKDAYYKTQIEIVVKNDLEDSFTIQPRIDMSKSDGNFHPRTNDIKNYLVNTLKYNSESEKKSSAGLKVIIDLKDCNEIESLLTPNDKIEQQFAQAQEDKNPTAQER